MTNTTEPSAASEPAQPLLYIYPDCKPFTEVGQNTARFRRPWFRPDALVPQTSKFIWWIIAIGAVMALFIGSAMIIGLLGLALIIGHIAFVIFRRNQVNQANGTPTQVTAVSIMLENLELARAKARKQAVEEAPPSAREVIMERLHSPGHTLVLSWPKRESRTSNRVTEVTRPDGKPDYLAEDIDVAVVILLPDGIFMLNCWYDAEEDDFVPGRHTSLLAWKQIASIHQSPTRLTFSLSSSADQIVYLGASRNQIKEEWSDDELLIPDDEVITKMINPFVQTAQNSLLNAQL